MKKIKTVGIEEEELKELKDLSTRTHISESELIRLALKEFLKDKERFKVIPGRVNKDPVLIQKFVNQNNDR